MIQPEENLELALILGQEGKDHPLGMYVVELPDIGHWYKAYEYKNEIAKTPALQYQPTTELEGIRLNKGSKYAIIVCTKGGKDKPAFKYTITAFSCTKFTFEPLTETWPHVIKKESDWDEDTAGGAPNDQDSFLKNPQFLLTFKTRTAFLVDLLVLDDATDPTGFMIFEQPKGTRKRITEISTDDIFFKPRGWIKQRTNVAYNTVTESTSQEYELVVIPSTLKPDVEKEFDLIVLADQEFEFVALGPDGPESSSESQSSSSDSESDESEDSEQDKQSGSFKDSAPKATESAIKKGKEESSDIESSEDDSSHQKNPVAKTGEKKQTPAKDQSSQTDSSKDEPNHEQESAKATPTKDKPSKSSKSSESESSTQDSED